MKLAGKHTKMKVSLVRTLGENKLFVLRELYQNLQLMAKEYYNGNDLIVDQFLQLYCLGENERKKFEVEV